MQRTMNASLCTLVLIDHQHRLMPIIDRHQNVLAEAAFLAATARQLDIPVIGTEQSPGKLGTLDASISRHCEVVMPKVNFDACADGLVGVLQAIDKKARRPDVVICGCEAHICLLQSAMGLIDAGFKVWVVASASGSRRPADRDLALRRLDRAGAQVITSEMAVFEWLKNCEHPKFRSVLAAVKARYSVATPPQIDYRFS